MFSLTVRSANLQLLQLDSIIKATLGHRLPVPWTTLTLPTIGTPTLITVRLGPHPVTPLRFLVLPCVAFIIPTPQALYGTNRVTFLCLTLLLLMTNSARKMTLFLLPISQ